MMTRLTLITGFFFLIGCNDRIMGDRAYSCSHGSCECPEGETCSTLTPEGLYFRGPNLGDSGFNLNPMLYPVAVGGSSNIALEAPPGSQLPTVPFEALADASLFDVSSDPDWHVHLLALNAGSSSLRIVSASQGELFDSKTIRAEPIEAMEFVQRWVTLPGDPHEKLPLRVVQGDSLSVLNQLTSSSGERLVDEALQFDVAPSGAATLTESSWDSVLIQGVELGTLTLKATAGGGATKSEAVEVVPGLDEIVISPQMGGDLPEVIAKYDFANFCAHGYQAGRLVLGVHWTYEVAGDAQVQPLLLRANCFFVDPTANGHAVITVSGGGIEKVVEFDLLME